jgi:hypothetical protein
MSANPRINLALTALALLAAVGVGLWLWVGTSISASMDRGVIPGLESEPFYPPADPLADAILGAAREALDHEVATLLGASRPADPAPPTDVDGAQETSGAPEPVAALPPLLESWPALAELGTGDAWILSVYLPTPDPDARGPHVRELTGPDVRQQVASLVVGLSSTASPELLARARWKVDRVLPGRRTIPSDGGYKGVAVDAGVDGIGLVHPDRGSPYLFLPSWSAERGTSRRKIVSVARRSARDVGGWSKEQANKARPFAFRTRAYVEAIGGGAPARPTQRGNAVGKESSAEAVREAIALAGAYLVRETSSKGKFTYRYDAYEDDGGSGYNMLRHAGTTYAMFQTYRLTGDEEVFDAAARAAGYFRARMREDDKHPGEWFILDDGGSRKRAKLGGAGLGLLAFIEMEKARPGSSDYEAMFGLARHLVRNQQEDGSFDSFYDWDGRERTDRKSTFYPGEALLALVRMHQLTGDERWVDVAVKGADYLVDDRWVALGLRIYVPPDAWLLQALEELDRVRPSTRRQDYAFAVSDSIARHKLMDPETAPPDLLGGDIGGLTSLPLAANSGSFGEALTAAARLERRVRPGESRHQTYAATNLTMQFRNQFTEANDWFLPNPERARGGFRFRPNDHEIGNDVVQHNISGLFGMLPLLDDAAPDIGLVVPESGRSPALRAAIEAAR